MKKFLVLGLILAVAGGAFAQSITFSGNVQTGIGIIFPEDEDAVIGLQREVYHQERTHGQAELNVVAVNEDGNASAHFGLRQGWGGTEAALILTGGHVRFNFLDNMITLAVGDGGPAGFGTGAPFNPHFNVGEGTGFSIVARPMDELTIGFSVHTNRAGFREFDAVRYVAGIRYALADVGVFVLNFRYNEGVLGTTPVEERVDIALGANLSALVADTGLSRLAIDFQALDLTKVRTGDYIDIRLSEGVTFVQDDLTVGIDLRQSFVIPDDGDTAMNFHFNLFGSYVVGDFTPGINIGFAAGGNVRADRAYRRPADVLSADASTNEIGDAMSFAINPYVTVALGSSITFQFGYTFATDIEGGGDRTYNAIYLNTALSF